MDEYDLTPDPDPDPDADAIGEAMAHAYAMQLCLRPVLIRMEEKRRVRLAVRASRAKRGAPSRERRSA